MVYANKQEATKIAKAGQAYAKKHFIEENSNTLLSKAITQDSVLAQRKDIGDFHYDYLHALIERNLHVNAKIAEYGKSLDECIKEVERITQELEALKNRKLRTKVKRHLRRIAKHS
jgi:hypothetical protein